MVLTMVATVSIVCVATLRLTFVDRRITEIRDHDWCNECGDVILLSIYDQYIF